jgi:hypothetical protein
VAVPFDIQNELSALKAMREGFPYGKILIEGCFLEETHAPDISALNYLEFEQYGAEFIESGVFGDEKLSALSNDKEPTKEEYRLFLRWWFNKASNDPDFIWKLYFVVEVDRSDGRTCAMLLEDDEGYTGLDDQFLGFFENQNEALNYLSEGRIIDLEAYDEKLAEKFVSYLVDQATGQE